MHPHYSFGPSTLGEPAIRSWSPPPCTRMSTGPQVIEGRAAESGRQREAEANAPPCRRSRLSPTGDLYRGRQRMVRLRFRVASCAQGGLVPGSDRSLPGRRVAGLAWTRLASHPTSRRVRDIACRCAANKSVQARGR